MFLTIEKRRATQKTVRKVLSHDQERTHLSKINTHIYQFYQQPCKATRNISEDSISNFLNVITVPSLTTEHSLSCAGNLTEKFSNSLICNDGLTKEFYYTFWEDIKDKFMK